MVLMERSIKACVLEYFEGKFFILVISKKTLVSRDACKVGSSFYQAHNLLQDMFLLLKILLDSSPFLLNYLFFCFKHIKQNNSLQLHVYYIQTTASSKLLFSHTLCIRSCIIY